ncbi:MAG: hypothetical protein K2Y32_08670 [Candidatus Obscuribacterales bacterium]|nr:hypothetical protein [Candidatus Obscuribacterales bacterium]
MKKKAEKSLCACILRTLPDKMASPDKLALSDKMASPRFSLPLSLLLPLVLLVPPIAALAFDENDLYKESSAAAASGSYTLSGGISHSERMEAVPESERVGTFFSGDYSQIALPRYSPNLQQAAKPQRHSAPVSTPRFSTAPTVDYSMIGVEEARRQAYLKSLPAGSKSNENRAVLKGSALKDSALKGSLKIKVPFWLAGTWERRETNETSRFDLINKKPLKAVGRQAARVVDVFGTTKDKSGQVFMNIPLSAAGSVDRGGFIDYHRVLAYQLIETGKNSCLVKVQARHSVVDKASRRVVQSYQDEELNSYKLVAPGLLRTDSSVKVFDEKGSPILLTKAISNERRIKGF